MRLCDTLPTAAFLFFLVAWIPDVHAQTTDESGGGYSQFGFGPALYFVRYNDEVIGDSKDVRIRADSTIDFSGSNYSTPLGLEVHYTFSLKSTRYRNVGETEWRSSRGVVASPYLGIYDVDDGVDGLSAGALIGFWKGDGNFENRNYLNVGVGYTIHRDRIVLADGITEGMPVPEGLDLVDLTTRRDVHGFVITVSASVGF